MKSAKDVEHLDQPVTDAWEMAGNLNEARDGHTATLLPDGKLLVGGGFDWNLRTYVSGTELYDPVSATWMTAASLGTARYGHTATLLLDGTVLVAGGETGLYGSITLESAERYGAPVADGCL